MKDVELMHMRYAMESAVLSLGSMGSIKNNEVKCYQMALCYLKDLKIHLEAINNIPRKVKLFSPSYYLIEKQHYCSHQLNLMSLEVAFLTHLLINELI